MTAKIKTLKPSVSMARLGTVNALTTQTQRMTGYGLQKRNKRWLSAHPLCAECERQGRVAAGVEVDHIIPLHLGGRDDESNLQTLCIPCHKAKTADEARGRGV